MSILGAGNVINEVPWPRSKPEISFDFSPHGAAYVYTAGATTFTPANAFHVAANTSITFTGTATFYHSDEYAVAYEWDFGDGTQGFGNPVTHTFSAAVPTIQPVLTVIDNKGRRLRARKQLYPTGPGHFSPSSYRDLVLEMNPSLYWPADATYGVTDQSGNSRNGTAQGGVAIGGYAGSPISADSTATDFDGSNDRITSSYSVFGASSTRTFAGWAYRDGHASAHTLFGGDGASGEPQLVANAGGQTVSWYTDSGAGGLALTTNLPGDALWFHWALIAIAGTSGQFFVNGTGAAAQPFATAYNSPGNFEIGSTVTGFAFWDGKIAHPAIFPRALTAGEIATLANG